MHENTNNHDILFKNANYIKILSKNGNNVISSTKSNELIVKIVPWGPNQAKVESITGRLLNRSSVKRYLKKSLQQQDLTKDRSLSAEGKIEKRRLRLLSFELIDDERIESNISTTTKKRKKTASTSPSTPPKFYRSIYYDYDNNCSLIIKGNIDKKGEPEEILESREQPLPNREEFEDAIKILEEREPDIGNAIRNNILRAYRPMPPLINEEKPDGSIERTLAVGLLPKFDANSSSSSSSSSTLQYQHEIVGVNMISQTVRRFESRAPTNSRADAAPSVCGAPNASQPTTPRGTAGQVKVTVRQGGKEIWSFIATRPAASSGTNGSGIELQYVNYRGKRVLRRANAPILNVQYASDACGPYRDWQWEESMIEATGTDIASTGFRQCPNPATTILDSGTDTGNFLGVGVYVDGQEVVLVSEMEAGWYRYISQWRLHADGTIRPRFGFDAVNSSCVCNPHHHHVYWRLNFDVDSSKNNTVEEYNDPPLAGSSSHWHVQKYEIKRLRDPTQKRKWRIVHSATGKGYMIVPGPNDGIADSFGRGDIWFLLNKKTEFDDGVVAIGPPYEALLDNFVNHELIKNKDIVIWYAAHFTHIVTGGDDTTGHIVGPDLVPLS